MHNELVAIDNNQVMKAIMYTVSCQFICFCVSTVYLHLLLNGYMEKTSLEERLHNLVIVLQRL